MIGFDVASAAQAVREAYASGFVVGFVAGVVFLVIVGQASGLLRGNR